MIEYYPVLKRTFPFSSAALTQFSLFFPLGFVLAGPTSMQKFTGQGSNPAIAATQATAGTRPDP